MPYLTHVPPEALRPFVAAAAGYRAPANPTGVHRGLPSRHLTLVVELSAPLRVAGAGYAVAAHAVVAGLHVSPAHIDAGAPQEGLQYGLTPFGVAALLGVPAAAVSGLAVDLADVLGARAGDLVERIAAAPGWPERFGVLDAALLQMLGDAALCRSEGNTEVTEAWRLIFEGAGSERVTAVAAQVGWSRRHLSERFRLATGLSPKQASRVARFEASRSLLVSDRMPLIEIASRCGFADQSHLAREWQALAGCSIGDWIREELPYVHDSTTADTARSGHEQS